MHVHAPSKNAQLHESGTPSCSFIYKLSQLAVPTNKQNHTHCYLLEWLLAAAAEQQERLGQELVPQVWVLLQLVLVWQLLQQARAALQRLQAQAQQLAWLA